MSETTLNTLLELRRQFLGFIERRVQDSCLAEDLLQSAYVRALDAGSTLRQDESAVAWFYRILRNTIIDHYRRRSTEAAALERWAKELEAETGLNAPLEETACDCIGKMLETLPPSYAALLREVDLAEKPLGEYAAAEGITLNNAAVRAHRARMALRRQLILCCGACAEHGCADCGCKASVTAQAG